MSERKKITMAQARANALEDVDKEITRAERERADEMADADLEHEELHEDCDMQIDELEARIAELERHQAEDRRAILWLLEKLRNVDACPDSVNGAIQRAREGT